ncbi:hypothetical protein BVRB_5g125190 isoform B [Beta vulgaris subsp. vulgaris]|uniref:Bifunctional inhibitor/plant lipid transfer protein/seed storage helical domain-containing protein n=1 Tax=Beta vulgaris subsp. vulgaris TaxID=3555 RepID=A0A0J8BCE8_BETVV|nr:hypothetical protein BVRB_5g125190 isoform B [Beta vulgaris subsp. vulgaris]
MDLRVMICVNLALASILLSCILPQKVGSQNPGCSLQGLQLDKCFNQEGEYIFFEPCCRAINQAFRVGFHCLCSILSTNSPQFTTLFSLSLSSCYIMVPPLTMCRDLGTMPISLPLPPNNSTEEIRTEQQNPLVQKHPTPTQATGVPLDPTRTGNYTAVERQPHQRKNATSMLHVVENGINNLSSAGSQATDLFCFRCLLLSLYVYSLALFS